MGNFLRNFGQLVESPKSGSLQMKVWLNAKPVKNYLSSHSNVFTPVSPISKIRDISGKIPVFGKIVLDIYRIFEIGETGIRIQYISITL